MSADVLFPAVGEDEAPFFEAAKSGELLIQQCSGCERLRHPPRPMCPWCRSLESNWALMSGKGTIWSFVVPHPPLLPEFSDLAPYNVIVVTLAEDPKIRLIGNLLKCAGDPINTLDPSTIRIGDEVSVVFDALSDDVAIPRWVPVVSTGVIS